MPPGAVRSVRSVRSVHVFQKFGGGVKVLLDIEDDKEGRLKRFNLNAEFISEVLLHYCAGLNIPVAKEADKYLEVIGDNLALSQKIRSQEIFAEHAEEPPLHHYRPASLIEIAEPPAARLARRPGWRIDFVFSCPRPRYLDNHRLQFSPGIFILDRPKSSRRGQFPLEWLHGGRDERQ